MKKAAVVFVLLVCWLLVDCIYFGIYSAKTVMDKITYDTQAAVFMETALATTPQAFLTISPTPDWPAYKANYALTATYEWKPPVNWEIEILQNGEPVKEQDGEYALQKAPFTLRARLPLYVFDELPVRITLNVLDHSGNYDKVEPGFYKNWYCGANDEDCIVFEINPEPAYSTDRLVIDQQNGVGSHLLYYSNPRDTHWDVAVFQGQEVLLERNVPRISLQKGENSFQDISIQKYNGSKLYLIFVLEYRAGIMITEDELQKAILNFE